MNGIQSLMQGAPTSPQPTQAPAMPAQNNPQMAAAMDVVDNDLDKLNLDPRTKALLKTQEAFDLIQSAKNELAMSQPQNDPPTIEGQRQMQTMDGIAGMLQSLRPGMQQRGQQVQRAQARKMIGGLPTQPAPNMRFAASGGLIGYNEGGFLGKIKEIDTKLNSAADEAQNERMARGRRMSDYNILAEPYDAAMNIMYDTGIAGALQKLTGYESQLNKPEEKDPMAEQLKRFMELQDLYETRKAAGAEQEELRRIERELASYSNVVRNIEADAARARDNGMAMGGQVKGYQEGMEVELDEDLIASLLAQQPETTGYAGPSTAERRAGLTDEAAARAQAREAKRAEQNMRVELAKAGLSGPLINEYLERAAQKSVDAVEPGGIAELKQPQFDTRSPQTGPFPTRPTATEFMPEGSSVTGGTGNVRPSKANKSVSGATAYDYMSDPNLYAPTEVEQRDGDILQFSRQQMGRDVGAEALAAGERLRELVGAEDLMAQRKEATTALQAQREARFNPEMERKRLIRQGLAGLAERGLGGFGAGYTAEEERIAGEKLSAAEASVADVDKLIGELRELGMSQFEAEKAAKEVASTAQNQGLAAAQAELSSIRQAETTRRGQDIQAETSRAIAKIQTSGSQFGRSLGIRIDEMQRNNPNLSTPEVESMALKSLVDDELRVGLARLGVSRSDQNRKEINDSITAATEMFSKNFANMTLSPEELQRQIFDLAQKIRTDLYGSAPGGGGGNVPTVASQAEFDALPSGAVYIENGVQYRKP